MTLIDVLRSNELLRGLSDDLLALVVDRATTQQLDSGEALFRQGDSGDAVYLVTTGRVEIVVEGDDGDRGMTVATFLPGNFFGELALLGGVRRTGTARTSEPTVVVRIDRELFATLTEASPAVMANVGHSLARHLISTTRAAVRSQRGEVVAILADDITVVFPLASRLAEELQHVHDGPVALIASCVVREDTRILGEDGIINANTPGVSRVDLWRAPATDHSGGGHDLNSSLETFRREWSRTLVVASLDDEWLPRGAEAFDRVILVCRNRDTLQCLPASMNEIVPIVEDRSAIPAWQRAAVAVHHPRQTTFLFREELDTGKQQQVRNAGVKRLARTIARRRVGVAFGAGGARGFAHIGVIRYLEECGIPVDAISGSSIGSLVAAAFAMGIDSHAGEEMLGHWLRDGQRQIIRPALSRHSVLSGRGLDRTCRDLFGTTRFSDLDTPLAVSVADLATGRGLAIRDGSLWKAVRASCSIPAIFPPVVVGDRVLVDGGVCDPVPVAALNRLGADIRIAVNISYSPDDLTRWAAEEGFDAPRSAALHEDLPNILETYQASFGMALSDRAAHTSSLADVVVRPRFRVTAWHDFASAPDQLQRGYEAAIRAEEAFRRTLPWLW